jgi:hypothetical protein
VNSAYWLNLIVFAIALESDIGRRRVGAFRILRPLVSALVLVPVFFRGMDTSENGLLLEGGAVLLGALLGLAASSFMRFEYDAGRQQAFSRTGVAFVAAWVAITLAKLSFSYGSTHWFGRALGTWMHENAISPDALRAAFIFLNIATMLARVGVIYFGGRRVAREAGAAHGVLQKAPSRLVG